MTVCDVGPRDGLQKEAKTLQPAVRAELCDRLAAAGLKRMEAASFVNPKLVPQMAGAEEVMAALRLKPDTVYAGLVLNEKGYERAVAAGVDEIHYALSAADEFGRRNQNATTDEGLKTALALVARARSDRMPVTVTVSVAFGSPFDGPVPAARVLQIVEGLMVIPPDEICLADTIGVGVPSQVHELVRGARATGAAVGAHFHNTRNTGYANAVAPLGAPGGVGGGRGGAGGRRGCWRARGPPRGAMRRLAPPRGGGAVQPPPVTLHRRQTLERGVRLIEEAATKGARLISFPET